MPIVVASREKILDVAAYNNPSGDLYDAPVTVGAAPVAAGAVAAKTA